ncbi:hypothetical protein [Chryseobacterium indoltheticum]|uniref:hypothetical protein n=1 Tax=Chryseobacterium indoltheticum TaxID=254 RepID=UPI003F495BAF
MEKIFSYLTNLSRALLKFYSIQSLELKEKDELNKGKSDICFISALEILKENLKNNAEGK